MNDGISDGDAVKIAPPPPVEQILAVTRYLLKRLRRPFMRANHLPTCLLASFHNNIFSMRRAGTESGGVTENLQFVFNIKYIIPGSKAKILKPQCSKLAKTTTGKVLFMIFLRRFFFKYLHSLYSYFMSSY